MCQWHILISVLQRGTKFIEDFKDFEDFIDLKDLKVPDNT